VVETPVPFEDEYTSGEELIIWDNLFAPSSGYLAVVLMKYFDDNTAALFG